MSFPRYESYKDSGVEWLGEAPEHWEVVPFYSVASERDERNKGMTEDNLLSLSYGRIIQKDISTNDGLLPESFETYQIVRQGDIVFRLTDLQNDKRSLRTAIVEEKKGIITSAYLAAAPFGIVSSYLSHLLRTYDLVKVFYSMGGGLRQSMKFSDVKRLPILAPTKEEQQTIAAFLDRETAKIDALITEQQRLIELLKEKRQSVISQAVTKGLNPNAPMKDSGIEWLGEVPEHWVKMVAKRVTNVFIPQRNKPELNNEGDGVFWATMEDMKNDEIIQTSCWVSERAIKEAGSRILPKGAVIASCVGNFGVASINEIDVIINQQLQAYIVKPSLKAEYLRYFLGVAKVYFEQVGTAATLTYVNQQGFENLPISLPPIIEQEKIISYLAVESAKLDTLVAEAQQSITLLQERRTALISAAVTGKIDVRGLA